MRQIECDLRIPKPLFGTHHECKKEWKKITINAIKSRSWDCALSRVEYVSIYDNSSCFVVDDPKCAPDAGAHFRLYLVHNLLHDECHRIFPFGTDETYLHIRDLNSIGSHLFWFVLSAFCSQMAGWQYSTDHASELPARAAEMLKAVCSFWRCLWPLRERFKHGNYPSQMPFWGGFAMGVGQLMGIPKDDILKIVHVAPEEAEQVMRGWLLMAGYA